MNKSDLEKIIAIAEEGSMARAAQKLYITQPALSKCLTKVEDSLGEALFVRRPNGMIPTYAGECLVRKAYQIMKLYDDVEMEFCELNQMHRGVLRLGTAERLGALVLPELLLNFKRQYPNIKIEIVEENSMDLEEKLLIGALEIAILCLPLKNANVSYQVFYEDPIYVALPSGHPLNDRAYQKEGSGEKYLDLEKLRGEEFILTRHVKKTRMAADRILANLGNDYEVMMESANIETVIRLVASGLGISLIPSIFARTYKTGDKIKDYRIEERYHPVWQWAVIYADSIENLTRPSKELYRILCEKGCQLPNYIE